MARSLCSNVVISSLYYCDDNFMDGNGYFVVMAYDNHYIAFDTFACLA
jgi:hypothetical protein